MWKNLLLSAFLFGVIYLLNINWSKTTTGKKVYVSPTKNLVHFTFGYSDVVADSLWLRLIQSYDLCEQNRRQGKELTKLELATKNRRFNCENGWVSRMLDIITDLAPKFRMPYATGGIMLSVVVDDRVGATHLFEKAVKQFPKDWSILYRAGYHYLHEEQNMERAAELFNMASQYGAPYWVSSLAARLYSKSGHAMVGVVVIKDFLENFGDTLDPAKYQVLQDRIKELQIQIRQENFGK